MDESLSYILGHSWQSWKLVLRQTNINKGGTDTRKRMDDSADYKRRP